MKSFALDLIHDLRQKRLLPVALLLAAAIVIVPVALRSSGGTSGGAPAATPASGGGPAADAGPVVTADASVKASRLGAYSSKNPFKSPQQPAASGQSATAGGTPPSSGSGDSASSPASGGSPSGGAPANSGGSAPSVGGGSPTPQIAPVAPIQPMQPKLRLYTWTVDVTVGKYGRKRTHHSVQRLDVLPNDREPVFVFLGAKTTGDTAVFIVDSTLHARGEGTCKPNPKNCSFLYLQTDAKHDEEHFFQERADGVVVDWTLKLDKIERVPVDQLKKSSKAAARRAIERGKRLNKRHAVPFHFLFQVPALADELSRRG